MLNVSRTEIPSIFEMEEEKKNSVKEMDDPVLSAVPATRRSRIDRFPFRVTHALVCIYPLLY